MCGRTACTLDKDGIRRATCQYSKDNKTNLEWVEKYDWQNYQPNYNLAPSQISPVLVSESVYDFQKNPDAIITPMRWGFIPHWYKGTMADFSLTTNNCRIEGILEKPTYKKAVAAGQRCVVLADGFYEWKVVSSKQKQPYFIYFPQESESEIFIQDYKAGVEGICKTPRLLTMAGLFDVWKSPKNETIYSYSVITLDSSKTVSFVHHRMPAILNGKEEISMWLDVKIPTKQAISILKPIDDLHMHPVSTLVNNSRNNAIDCLKPIKKDGSQPKTIKHTALTAWLIKEKTGESPAKRLKSDI